MVLLFVGDRGGNEESIRFRLRRFRVFLILGWRSCYEYFGWYRLGFLFFVGSGVRSVGFGICLFIKVGGLFCCVVVIRFFVG